MSLSTTSAHRFGFSPTSCHLVVRIAISLIILNAIPMTGIALGQEKDKPEYFLLELADHGSDKIAKVVIYNE